MGTEQLDAVARHLLIGYADTGTYSQEFRDQHDLPPSLMSKVHHLRSVLQARLVSDPNYHLDPAYLDYGRVQFVDLKAGATYLLKSLAAVKFESSDVLADGALFPTKGLIRSADLSVIVYEFKANGLDLSIAPGITRGRSRKVYVAEKPVHVGTWPYSFDGGNGTPFDQSGSDTFRDIGNIGHDEATGDPE